MKIIKNWNDLVGMSNDEYYLDINTDIGFGWVRKRIDDSTVAYLSTHTFYEKKYEFSTEILQSFGFDVKLVSWG
jgi:hypothetical protein